MQVQELRNLIGNKIATVTFVKRHTGELRRMNCRLGVTRYLKGTGPAYDASAHKLLTVFDMQKKAYRSIPVENVVEVKAHKKVVFTNPVTPPSQRELAL